MQKIHPFKMFRQPPVKLNFSFALTRQLVMPNPVCMHRNREKKISELNWISNLNWNFTSSIHVLTSVFVWFKCPKISLKMDLSPPFSIILWLRGILTSKITPKKLTFAFIGTGFCGPSPGLVVVHGETLLTVGSIGIVPTPTLFSPLKVWGGALT